MTFTPMFGTGFEMGCVPFLSSDLVTEEHGVHTSYDGVSAHSGNYMFRLRNGDVKIDVAGTQKEIYISVWHHPLDNFSSGNDTWIRIVLTDGNYLELRKFAGNQFDASINGVAVENGSTDIQYKWNRISVYFLVSNAGKIISKIDGNEDVNYSGDTMPGDPASTINYLRIRGGEGIGSQDTLWDDLVFGDDGWPNDIRFEPLPAVGDTPTEDWDLSAGADSYALIDEVPCNDADYIYSTANGEQTIVELDNWDATEKTPEFVVIWARAKKDVADAHKIKLINDDGVNTEVGDAQDLLTSYKYVHELLLSAPDGFQWNDTKVDTLNLGVESVVV